MAHLGYFGRVILVLSCVKNRDFSFRHTLNELVETFEMMFLHQRVIVPTSPVGYLRPGSQSPFQELWLKILMSCFLWMILNYTPLLLKVEEFIKQHVSQGQKQTKTNVDG